MSFHYYKKMLMLLLLSTNQQSKMEPDRYKIFQQPILILGSKNVPISTKYKYQTKQTLGKNPQNGQTEYL